MTKRTDATPPPAKWFRIRMIMLKWYVIRECANHRRLDMLGPYDKINEAEQAAIDTGLLDADKEVIL